MKKTYRMMLILVLALAIALGCWYGVSASDEDDPSSGCAKVTQVA